MPRTRRADCSAPGIGRVRRGRGFSYTDADGRRVEDAETLSRIAELAIPPAWTEVWICPDPRGHIQATGVDDAGRKQYRYHDDWRTRRDAAKFDAMLDFARALPRLRRRMERDLRGDALDGPRVAACAVRLLDVGLFRVGAERYAEENGSFGLTTLRRSHVRRANGLLHFDFDAKSGQRRRQRIGDPVALPVVEQLKARRGGPPNLFAYRPDGDEGAWSTLTAGEVNAYLVEAAGVPCSAKDFRTWNATALCAIELSAHGTASSARARNRRIGEAVRDVALMLGNTPAVCRRSYIDPRVIDSYESGTTIPSRLSSHAEPDPDGPVEEQVVSDAVRRAVIELIESAERG